MRRAWRVAHLLLICVALPLCLSAVAYYGFIGNYRGGTFSEAGFRAHYESGVYKYRVLGRYVLLLTHDLVRLGGSPESLVSQPLIPRRLAAMVPDADPEFYLSYFLMNAVFLCLACTVLYWLLHRSGPPGEARTIGSSVLLVASLVALSQFVVTPYDNLSYFLFLLGVHFSLRSASSAALPGLVVTLVLAALTRESAALLLSAYFALHGTSLLRIPRPHFVRLALLTLVFLAVYVGLRYWLGPGGTIHHGLRLSGNLMDTSCQMGLLLFGAVTYVLFESSPNREACLRFLLASAPYVVAMLLVANAWEIRLWIPLWIGVFVVGRCANSAGPATRPGPVVC